jgi:predicted ATP-grasp superfamily ATP-dependent carboligase
MARILLTGGRAPATLELARIFHAAGHAVFMAESLRYHLARPSRALVRNYLVPAPKHAPHRYIDALCAIVCRERIDLLVPTCEEVFWIAKGRARLATHCTLLVEEIERLRQLHHKGSFAALARGYGLAVPQTVLLETPADLHSLIARDWDGMTQVVLKPAYSRFGARTLIPGQFGAGHESQNRESPNRGLDQAGLENVLRRLEPTSPWVAQQYIGGRQLCSYSVAHAGKLAAHTTYAADLRAGPQASSAPAIVFQHLDHAGILAWVRHFVEQEHFSGQIAFDFIEGEAGENATGFFAIECNPRATSGIHLLAETPGFANSFFAGIGLKSQPTGACLTPTTARPAMLAPAMLCYALPAIRSWSALRHWLATMRRGRDVIFTWRDPLPALGQALAISALVANAWRLGISPVEASTVDIEWNGE